MTPLVSLDDVLTFGATVDGALSTVVEDEEERALDKSIEEMDRKAREEEEEEEQVTTTTTKVRLGDTV